jgi:hypothetical protein
MNIDINKAIKLGFEYVKDLYDNQNQNIPNLLLEEARRLGFVPQPSLLVLARE